MSDTPVEILSDVVELPAGIPYELPVETPSELPVETPFEFPVDTSSNVPLDIPYVNDVITLDSIVSDYEVAIQKETDIKVFLITNLIGASSSSFKPKLLEWASARFPAVYPIWSVNIEVPTKCSDGASRNIHAYLEFCLKMTLADLLVQLQPKFVNIQLTYMFQGNTFSIAVIKA